VSELAIEMGLYSTRECVEALSRAVKTGELKRVEVEVEIDPALEAAEIQRRVYANGGSALLAR
jgi:3-polyprenyl-4-hydroxybenzoate decarboxylase